MRRLVFIGFSALTGIAFCFLWVVLLERIGGGVNFPAPGGESDFSKRFSYFLFGVVPAFAFLGAWIGNASLNRWKLWFAMWIGVVVASVIIELCVRGMRDYFALMTKPGEATQALLFVFVLWVAVAIFVIVLIRRMSTRKD